MNRYFKGTGWIESMAWCQIKDSFANKEDFLKAPLMTLRESMTLGQYLKGEAERIDREKENPTKKVKLLRVWRRLKEVFL